MTANLPARIDDLPKSLLELADILGIRIALKLVSEFGGCDVKFPKTLPANHVLIEVLGEEDALAVCGYMDGGTAYIPHARTGSTRREILNLEKRGLNRPDIARQLGLSSRHVRRLANKSGPTNAALRDLFDE
jgi:Homeodomain-like domain